MTLKNMSLTCINKGLGFRCVVEKILIIICQSGLRLNCEQFYQKAKNNFCFLQFVYCLFSLNKSIVHNWSE